MSVSETGPKLVTKMSVFTSVTLSGRQRIIRYSIEQQSTTIEHILSYTFFFFFQSIIMTNAMLLIYHGIRWTVAGPNKKNKNDTDE